MMAGILAAMIGTAAFSVLYRVPRRFYLVCSLIGGAGWLVYCLAEPYVYETWACLFATLVVVFLARLTAVWRQCPATVFLIPGIFPLVPGAGIYWTSFYLVTGQMGQALSTGYAAVKAAVAIVLGIVFIFEIPQSWFVAMIPRREKQ